MLLTAPLFTSSTAFVTALILAYLCGSLPFGLWVGRLCGSGLDVRTKGSRSTGATNVLRTAGKKAALATVILDMAKGALPTIVALYLAVPHAPWIGLCAVIGHIFPLFAGFKGGKGVATGGGVFLALSWPVALCSCIFFALMARLTRYSSLASLCTGALAPLLFIYLGDKETATMALVLAVLLQWTHRGNLRRLWEGKEPRIGQRIERPTDSDPDHDMAP